MFVWVGGALWGGGTNRIPRERACLQATVVVYEVCSLLFSIKVHDWLFTKH